MKNISWRWIVVLAVIAAAIVYTLPTFKPGLWPHKKINLGLDLQGGMHLVLEVDAEKTVESAIDRIHQDLRSFMRKEHIANTRVESPKAAEITVHVPEDQLEKFEALLDKQFRELRLASKSSDNGTVTMRFDLPEAETEHIKTMAVDQALETIRNRIDEFGVSEPDIRREGEQRVLIQLPGITDTQRAKQLIGRTALLEFKLVDDAHDPRAAMEGGLPPGTELLYEVETDPITHRTIKTPFLAALANAFDRRLPPDARVQIDSQYNEPYVSIEFDKKGAMIFERVTGENVKKRLAIVLDKKVYSAPVIQEKISGGSARITGNFTTEEAKDLAIVLRAGALPAPVNIIEERTVGPSLGSDSIRMGLISMLIGGLLVLVFMIVYYNFSGIIADLALMINIVLIAAGLAVFQATLTMPGIAGIILTIGMAVDANVLIFERIREEISLGKTALAALAAGYDRATLTILDANVTTLIAALVLFQFGTGPVKGFAVTLSLGVLSSLFTALVLTRAFFDYLLINRKMKRLSI